MIIKNHNYTKRIVEEITFNFLPNDFSKDLRKSIENGISNGAVFPSSSDSLTIFRNAVAEAITDIEEKGEILCRFLKDGPYWDAGDIPELYSNKCLADEATGTAISFIYGHIINCFQGRLAELLSIEPCINLLNSLRSEYKYLNNSILYFGDSILVKRFNTINKLKGADFHIINTNSKNGTAHIYGLCEVKSYNCSQKFIQKQIRNNIARLKDGFYILSNFYSRKKIFFGSTDQL